MFSQNTVTALGFYVYALVDPSDTKIFYVGKANANNRAFDHLKSTKGQSDKEIKIRGIQLRGDEVGIEILRYGLKSELDAFEVEAAVIDAIGIENLKNEIRGHGISRGRMSAVKAELMLGSPAVNVEGVDASTLVFFTQNSYSPTHDEQQLYDSVRQFWSGISHDTRTPDCNGRLPVRVALSVVDGVVIGAYTIEAWFKAGVTQSSRKFSSVDTNRWEFVGKKFTHSWVGKRILKDGNPVPAVQKGYRYFHPESRAIKGGCVA